MIYLDQPEITDADAFEIAWESKHGDPSTRSKTVREFEKAMAKYLKVPDAVAVNSGTSALHLVLLACGVGKGDEVVLPVLTFIATANAVSYAGAKPVFVDVNSDTWNIDYKGIWGKKVLLSVNLYGNPCFATTYDMPIIQDCAESLGAKSEWLEVGNVIKCYSFNGNKTLTTGSGGLIVGNNLSKIRQLADVGRDKNGEFVEIGYNYRMNGLSAALGLSQLKRLDETVAKKRRINEIYRNELDNVLTFQGETPNSKSSFWLTAALFPRQNPVFSIEYSEAQVMQHKLKCQGIPTRRIFEPLNNLKPYLRDKKIVTPTPIAEYIYNLGLCLPSSVLNSGKDILTICKSIKKEIKK